MRRQGLLLAGVGILVPWAASAHLVSSGVGPFYDGMAHFFVSPEDVVVAVALALFGGLSGQPAARRLVLALPIAWLAGALLGCRLVGPTSSGWVSAAGILVAGLLVAVNPKIPAAVPAALAVVLGILHGYLNGRAMASTDTPFAAAVGITVALAVLVLMISALTVSLRVPWHRIAARVLGSWAAAIGLLTLAWRLRPGP